ncbi:MAG: hypothetical protein OEY91_13255 [Nitrospirota bacterium]|nr:hypothetical protein [Nitrospirota bacterium]
MNQKKQHLLLRGISMSLFSLLWILASPTWAHEPHACQPDFPDAPILNGHLEQDDIGQGRVSFSRLFERGRQLFSAQFNTCDGQGRPATTGAGDKRIPDEPARIRTSSPDSDSCAGCHNQPRPGGSGDFVANVFVLAQALDPVTFSVSPEFSNERNTLGMNGAGAIEMLAREMTADLQAQAQALPDGTHTLLTKGIAFEITKSGGAVVSSKGVDTDLIIKPFHQAGVVRSIREFTVNAMNHHHGMQAEERFDLNPAKGMESDYDEDGVPRELTIGDMTAATIFQAGLGIPGRIMPVQHQDKKLVKNGEELFGGIGCVSCHSPKLILNSRNFVEPNPLNPPGTFNDSQAPFVFDMTLQGEGPYLEKDRQGTAIVRAYTDLKRHNLCDAEIRFFCNEQLAQGRPAQDGRPGEEFFITRKLWDVGNSAPYGHRGDLTTITEAILAHGGEGRATRDAFVALDHNDQRAVVAFLKTLQVLPAGSPAIVVAPALQGHAHD